MKGFRVSYGALPGIGGAPRERAQTTPFEDSEILDEDIGLASEVFSPVARRTQDDMGLARDRGNPKLRRKSSIKQFIDILEDDTRQVYLSWMDEYGAAVPKKKAGDRESILLLHKPRVEDEGEGGTISRAVVTFVKSMIGAYILYSPKMTRNGGLTFSVLGTVAIAGLSMCNMLMLMASAAASGQHTFGHVAYAAYGFWGQAAVDSSLVLSQLGYCVTYIVYISTNLVRAFPEDGSGLGFLQDRRTLILLLVLIQIPLSWIRRLTAMALGMFIANACIVLGLVLILWDCVGILAERGPQPVSQFEPSTFVFFIGSVVNCYEGIGLVLPIQDSLAPQAREHFPLVLAVVMSCLSVLYAGFGAVGYLTFGKGVSNFVTMDLPDNSVVGSVTIVAYSIAIMLTYPLQLFPASRCIELYVFEEESKPSVVRKWQKNLLRASLVCLTAVVAIKAGPRFDNFASLIGGLCAVPLALVYPVLFYLKLCAVRETWWMAAGRYAMLAVGTVAMVVCTALALFTWE